MRPSYKQPAGLRRGLRGLVALALLGLLLCADAALGAAPRLGVALPSFRESRWGYDLQAIRAQADRHKVNILVRFAGNSQEQQNIQVQELVNLGVDALLIVPNDAYGAVAAVRYAHDRGVPVIAYDRLLFNCPLDAYVTFEQTQVGELQGKFLAEHAPKGDYILISGAKEDGNSVMFRAGAMKYLQPLIDRGDIRVVADGEAVGWKPESAKDLVRKALERSDRIRGVLAPNDDTAGGALEALADKGLAGSVAVSGQDANAGGLDRMYRGIQGMSVFKDTDLLAAEAVRVALGLLRKEPPVPDTFVDNGLGRVPTYYRPVMFVDKNTIPWLLRLPEFR